MHVRYPEIFYLFNSPTYRCLYVYNIRGECLPWLHWVARIREFQFFMTLNLTDGLERRCGLWIIRIDLRLKETL